MKDCARSNISRFVNMYAALETTQQTAEYELSVFWTGSEKSSWHDRTLNMSQQGYVAAPPYSQAQPGIGGYQGGFGSSPAQPLYGHYGGAPPPGKTHFKFAPCIHLKLGK